MEMVANIILALGATPRMDDQNFIPKYPDTLPLSVSDGLIVGLKKYSKDLVGSVFMEIEKPETPLHFPVDDFGEESTRDFATIGAFYSSIAKRIKELGEIIFTGEPGHQVVIDSGGLWQLLEPVNNVESAVSAINWIIEDGEGTSKMPFDGGEEDLAHYYKFEELFHGRRLIATGPDTFAYAGDVIEIDASGILDLPDNPKASHYAQGSQSRQAVDAFNMQYSRMMRSLQRTFGGEPEQIAAALGIMTRLRTIAVQVVGLTDPETGKNLGLTYEYMPEQLG